MNPYQGSPPKPDRAYQFAQQLAPFERYLDREAIQNREEIINSAELDKRSQKESNEMINSI